MARPSSDTPAPSELLEEVRAGYVFDGPALGLGAAVAETTSSSGSGSTRSSARSGGRSAVTSRSSGASSAFTPSWNSITAATICAISGSDRKAA